MKEYYVSQTNYNGLFGIKDVLSARGSENARFNVMALSDYSSGYNYHNSIPSEKITFGEWSVPTKELGATFGEKLKITASNYSEYGLKL